MWNGMIFARTTLKLLPMNAPRDASGMAGPVLNFFPRLVYFRIFRCYVLVYSGFWQNIRKSSQSVFDAPDTCQTGSKWRTFFNPWCQVIRFRIIVIPQRLRLPGIHRQWQRREILFINLVHARWVNKSFMFYVNSDLHFWILTFLVLQLRLFRQLFICTLKILVLCQSNSEDTKHKFNQIADKYLT